jgi:S-adenosylmethionine:tRNA ribosyltransferase-isomerase
MDASDFEYLLPDQAIAQEPAARRDAARLLVDRGPGRAPGHGIVADLPGLVEAGDVVVVNDTRVRAARLRLRKATGGAAEVLLLDDEGDGSWIALVRPGRRLPPGTVLASPGGGPDVVVGEALAGGRRRVQVVGELDSHGELPLPPYIHRPLDDVERYQTVYAARAASAAAPTAGLHLTEPLLQSMRDAGVTVARLELVVGLDTFRPMATERVEDHVMHTEAYDVPAATLDACERARAAGHHVVAVGTTVVRALEAAATTGRLTGRTDLLIAGEHRFSSVDRLLTNFHRPRTTLLALVDAFVGRRWRTLYGIALDEGYRFLSFGDAMLLRNERGPA